MALSMKPWGSISESDYSSPDAFCSACLVDSNPSGQAKTKANCHLPVREPNGALSRNGMLAAQGALVGARADMTSISREAKVQAAKKLARLMQSNGMQPAMSLKQMAGTMNG